MYIYTSVINCTLDKEESIILGIEPAGTLQLILPMHHSGTYAASVCVSCIILDFFLFFVKDSVVNLLLKGRILMLLLLEGLQNVFKWDSNLCVLHLSIVANYPVCGLNCTVRSRNVFILCFLVKQKHQLFENRNERFLFRRPFMSSKYWRPKNSPTLNRLLNLVSILILNLLQSMREAVHSSL